MPMPPQGRGPPAVPRQGLERRPQRRVGIEDARRQLLEEVRLVGRDPEVAQLDLRLRPGEARRALEHRRVAVLVGEREDGVPRSRRRRVARCTRAVAPGARRTRRRRLKTGSSTVPAVLESGRRSAIDDRVAGPCGRGRGSGRGRSRTGRCRPSRPRRPSPGRPRSAARGRAAGARPRGPRGRRRTRSHEEIRKGGVRRVGGRRARGRSRRTTSPRSRRGRVPRLVSDTWRISASSSVETTTCRDVVIGAVACDGSRCGPPSRRPRRCRARRRSAGSPPTRPCPLSRRAGRRRLPHGSRVASSRQRVTARPRQRL